MKMKMKKNNVKNYRVWKGLTRADLAKEVRVSLSYLVLIENEHIVPKRHIIRRLCECFGIDEDQFWRVL